MCLSLVEGMSIDMKPATGSRRRSGSRPLELLLRLAGTGLLWATAGLHLDLYLTGYRTIPTIGWLFLLQVIAAFGLGSLVLATGSRLVALAGALFALSTLGGYLLSIQFGLFGFREVRTTAGIVAAVIEVAAFASLVMYAATANASPDRKPGYDMFPSPSVAQAGLAAVGVSALAVGLTAGALAGVSGTGGSLAGQGGAGGILRATTIAGSTVLTNSQGRTLYWFGPDTSTKSACNSSCAAYWPPLHGPQTAGPGVIGRLGTIKRADGSIQETYNGHPLYTYIGDSGPGQAHGNNLDLNGGYWHEVLVSG
jgi:predicted lipoprotein with Yx(FWY)xxD motif